MHERRAARECAVKSLYAQKMTDERMEKVVLELMEREGVPKDVRDFCKNLAIKTYVHTDELDEMIREKSEHWEFTRIALLDKIILRLAIAEMLYFDDVPPKVSISEAINIAKNYSTENSGSFINGILDSILNDLKSEGRIFIE